MRLKITAKGFELSDAIREHAELQFQKTNHFHEVEKTGHSLILEPKGAHHQQAKAELIVHLKDREIISEASHEDLYQAITECAKKSLQQLQKHHEKHKPKHVDIKRSSL